VNFATANFATMNSTDPAGIKSTAAETASGEPTKSAGVGNSLPDPSNSTDLTDERLAVGIMAAIRINSAGPTVAHSESDLFWLPSAAAERNRSPQRRV
jgi:hypothetical protein